MNTIHIENLDQDIQIKKLPLGKYSELIKAIDKDLPQLFKQFEGMDTDDESAMLEKLPEIITNALPQFQKLLAIATYIRNDDRKLVQQLTEQDFEDSVGLDEAVEILTAAWDVNNLKQLADKAKKWMPKKPAKGTQTPKQPAGQ